VDQYMLADDGFHFIRALRRQFGFPVSQHSVIPYF
jgi:hypothetical protein